VSRPVEEMLLCKTFPSVRGCRRTRDTPGAVARFERQQRDRGDLLASFMLGIGAASPSLDRVDAVESHRRRLCVTDVAPSTDEKPMHDEVDGGTRADFSGAGQEKKRLNNTDIEVLRGYFW
jgi:hypothetical protein